MLQEAVVIIKSLAVGPIQANCFIIGCETTLAGAVIDPGDDADRIMAEVKKANLRIDAIINTHGHFDHVGGNRQLKAATGAELLIHPLDAPMLAQLDRMAGSFGLKADNSPDPDRTLEDGDTISVGELRFKVLHTPGHTPGGIALHTNGCVFVGDTLFQGSIGRTDFPGGDFDTLITSIRTKLFTLDEQTTVYTGHGPETTIGTEKRYNPFARMT
jgi:glyoxylase-like metal-dependent hydrolase (beta-lactamase superfamily II)